MLDSHAHIASAQFDSDRDVLIASAKESGLSWIEVGTDVAGSARAVDIAKLYNNIFASVGVHPDDIGSISEEDWGTLERLANNPNVCSIGEVGFDTYRAGNISEQEPVLRRFISLAQKTNKPIIFHVRSGNGIDVHAELIRVLKDYADSDRPKGVIHTFSGTLEQAEEYVALGMMISFSGVITFKNAGELREIAQKISLDSILVETDCPYLTPEPFRGKRNEPSYVRYGIQVIANLRGVSFEEVEETTERNAKKLFRLFHAS